MLIPYATLTRQLLSKIELPSHKGGLVPSASTIKIIDAEWESLEGRCLVTMSAYYAVHRYHSWEANQDFRFDYWVGFVTCRDRDSFFAEHLAPHLKSVAA